MSFTDYIKNTLVKFVRERYRYGFSHTIFVSDVFGCHTKAYLDRIFNAIPPLSSLEKMYVGIVWEKLIGEPLPEKFGAIHEPELMAEYTIGNDTVYLLGHPDFITKNEIIEIKSTNYTKEGVKRIVSSINTLLRAMKGVAPSLFAVYPILNVDRSGRTLPLYGNWVAQVNAYNYMMTQRPKSRSYLVVVYADDIIGEDVTDFFAQVRDELKRLIPPTYVAISKSSEKFDPKVVDELLKLEMYYNWLYASYQCRTCPYYEMGVCRGLPPIRALSYTSPSDPTYKAIKTWYEYFGSKGDNFAITNGSFDFNKLLMNLFGEPLRHRETIKEYLARHNLSPGAFLGIVYQDIYCRFVGGGYPHCIQSPPIEVPQITKETLHRVDYGYFLRKIKGGEEG